MPDKSSGKAKMALLHSRPPAPLQRLLFSATLTDNPAKLALLNVVDPLILHCAAADHAAGIGGDEEGKSGEEKEGGGAFTLPAGLSEAMAVCTTAKRPLILACLLAEAFDKVASSTSFDGPASRSDDVDESKENETEAAAEAGAGAREQPVEAKEVPHRGVQVGPGGGRRRIGDGGPAGPRRTDGLDGLPEVLDGAEHELRLP